MFFNPIVTNIISTIFGKFAKIKFPFVVQYSINWIYVKSMGVDLQEFAPLKSYKTLNLLFTRKLQKKRTFDTNNKIFISPCDSFITECGNLHTNQAIQIKGFSYNIDELLTKKIDKELISRVYNGNFINFYLSPKDYHRYHSPIDMQIEKAVHVPGTLYPVNLKYLHKVPELFVKNERVILQCKTNDNILFFMVFVGALNVGKIKFNFDKRIQTNCSKKDITTYMYGNIKIKKGEEIGNFEMGSTIVIFFEKGSTKILKNANTQINFSDSIAELI